MGKPGTLLSSVTPEARIPLTEFSGGDEADCSGGLLGLLQGHIGAVGQCGDMPHLPAFPHRSLPVDMQVGVRQAQGLLYPGHPQAPVLLFAQQVHHRCRAAKLDFAKGKAADRPNVLLELGDAAGLDAQVPRIVHPRRQLLPAQYL